MQYGVLRACVCFGLVGAERDKGRDRDRDRQRERDRERERKKTELFIEEGNRAPVCEAMQSGRPRSQGDKSERRRRISLVADRSRVYYRTKCVVNRAETERGGGGRESGRERERGRKRRDRFRNDTQKARTFLRWRYSYSTSGELGSGEIRYSVPTLPLKKSHMAGSAG